MKLIADIWRALPFQVKTILFASVGILILLAIVFGQIGACRSRREEKKIANIQANIKTSEIEANVLTNTQVEVETNANNASSNTNRVLNTDSRDRESDFGAVKRRWCEDHPRDSKCQR